MSGRAGWLALGASVAGTAHVDYGRGCEDRFHIKYLQDTGIALVVADGAGSAVAGAEGADAATRGVAKYLQDFAHVTSPASVAQWLETLKAIIAAARSAVEDEFTLTSGGDNPEATRDSPDNDMGNGDAPGLGDLATTLIVVIARAGWIGVSQIGDGCVVARTVTGEIQAIGHPEASVHVNETRFLTDADYKEHARYFVCPAQNFNGIAVLSDGLQFLAYDMKTQSPFAPFFCPLFEFAARLGATEAELEAFLRSPRVCARTTDDKTLVLAVRSKVGKPK